MIGQAMADVSQEELEKLAAALCASAGQSCEMALGYWLMAEQMLLELMFASHCVQVTVHQKIRERAYFLWESTGREFGRELDFWLAAERSLFEEVAREFQAAFAEARRGRILPASRTPESDD